MKLSRRGALLACISTGVGTLEAKDPKVAYSVELKDSYLDYKRQDCTPIKANSAFVACRTPEVKYDFALEIKYMERVVRFTPTELMDILEGKGL